MRLGADKNATGDWASIESNARRQWERGHPGAWDRFKEWADALLVASPVVTGNRRADGRGADEISGRRLECQRASSTTGTFGKKLLKGDRRLPDTDYDPGKP
jgi:hypothetical protein